jgi:hypothetical protein
MTFTKTLFFLVLTALLAACGGGGGGSSITTGIGSGGTGGVSAGPVSGFGSIIVNGVKFDDAGAAVTIDDRSDRPVTEIRLGMMVEVHGTIDDGGTTGKATTIKASSQVEGPVASIDPVANSFVSLGQTVRVNINTVFEGLANLAALGAGDLVEVHGLTDPSTGIITATRVERKPPFVSGVTEFSLVGAISSLNSTSTTCTFKIGAATVNCAGTTLLSVPASGLANGMLVKIEIKPVSATLSALISLAPIIVASSVRALDGLVVSEGNRVEVEGIISNFASVSSFQVNAQKVDASKARFENGTSADLANGKRVEVEGKVANGVLVADKVEFKQEQVAQQAELQGLITDFVSVSSFKVRGQLVDASAATISNGTAANLANGRLVEVHGPIVGNVLKATQVEFKESTVQDGARVSVEGVISDFVSASDFKVNGQKVSTSASTIFEGGTAANLANTRKVEAEGAITGGILIATKLTFKNADDSSSVNADGLISDFVSPTSFKINGVSVTTSSQTVYVNGTQANLANGVRVEITGTLSAGKLTATQIKFKVEEVQGESDVEGYISNFVSISNFKVSGQIVDASAAAFDHGSASDLANGVKIEAKGNVSNGVLKATRIEIKH